VFAQMGFLNLPERTIKERSFGLTSIIDTGVPTGELHHILADYHDIIDFAKLGVGSAYVTSGIKSKIELYKSYNIHPYCGGTLFEKCYVQNKFNDYLKYLDGLGIEWIEISSGVLEIPLDERLQIVQNAKKHFSVIAEVGSKDETSQMPVSEWLVEVNAMIDAGCRYVIAEGRGSGTAGIYSGNGEIRSDIVLDLFKNVDPNKMIFEAPTSKSQAFFINHLGTNVNLGNVNPHDVLLLEVQRNGIRTETFFLENDARQFS
jgi:phosphosulfolactate synthase